MKELMSNGKKNKPKKKAQSSTDATQESTRTTEKHLNKFAAARKQRYEEAKYQTPVPMRTYGVDPAPPLVVVFGPKSSGKSLLMHSLIRKYTKQRIDEISGIVTLMASKTKRLSFYECPNDLISMVDASKVADLLILVVDATVGIEIEAFEMLNLLKTHGFPKIACVVTKVDQIKEVTQQRTLIKKIKKRMWKEICDGIKVFAMNKVIGNKYPDREVSSLTRYITQMKYRPILWRSSHPYVVADQLLREDRTEEQTAPVPPAMHRFTVTGYVRGGLAIHQHATVHIPGVGDYPLESIKPLDDPCPLLSSQKKRLSERKKPLYAPTSEVRGIKAAPDGLYISPSPSATASLPYASPAPTAFALFHDNTRQLHHTPPETAPAAERLTPPTTEHLTPSATPLTNALTNTPSVTPSITERLTERDVESDVESVTSDSDGYDLMAITRMFRKKEQTKEEYTEKFYEEYEIKEKEKDERDIYTQRKEKVKEQEEASSLILSNHSKDKRLYIEGVPPGTYVKISIILPEKVLSVYEPERLFLLGAIKQEEQQEAYTQGRVKRHKWFKKILKTKEPHYVTMGWRRFQCVPVFSTKDAVRNKMLKYIPESLTCSVTFYGPIYAPGTGFSLLRQLKEEKNFRVSANGVSVEVGDAPKIMKKLKLIGYPSEIKGHTVFVKDMFHSTEEAAVHEGAILKTVSGLRGELKKAGADGTFRGTFEGPIQMSDIVFLPCFVSIPIPSIYLNAEIFKDSSSIRLLKEIRESLNIPFVQQSNSQYNEVTPPSIKKVKPLPTSILSKAPFSMLEKEPEHIPFCGSKESLVRIKALEEISRKANELKEQKRRIREERIEEILKERKEYRKKRVDKAKEEAKELAREENMRKMKKNNKTNKTHKTHKKRRTA
ncbi:ribosome biogenesis protein BMS1 [Nematocida sp. LUAm3]|nr:ribosome biogenesis protein BMS1 [Nematocida sp. LUAm3]KAI5175166.1 ribosome biogenesis protein BMS1 [Nematocida sp. LUAm2]KAI5178162.1 ribosome biogenesis protein BMS1 [Nematocida sp. LUAm1]